MAALPPAKYTRQQLRDFADLVFTTRDISSFQLLAGQGTYRDAAIRQFNRVVPAINALLEAGALRPLATNGIGARHPDAVLIIDNETTAHIINREGHLVFLNPNRSERQIPLSLMMGQQYRLDLSQTKTIEEPNAIRMKSVATSALAPLGRVAAAVIADGGRWHVARAITSVRNWVFLIAFASALLTPAMAQGAGLGKFVGENAGILVPAALGLFVVFASRACRLLKAFGCSVIGPHHQPWKQ